MRYYSIVISDPATGEVFVPNVNNKPGFSKVSPGALVSTYSSLKSGMTPSMQGSTRMGAQNIELDIQAAPLHIPTGAAYLKIWGISLAEISQASNLNNMSIEIYGGMAKGLPLANPAQSGLLIQGSIQQAFGNWVAVNQTLDIMINTPYGEATKPRNIVLQWKRGQKLADAIDNSLAVAFPEYKRVININSNLVLTSDQEPGYFQTAAQFAFYLRQLSISILGGDYPGVDVLLTQDTFSVYDNTTLSTPTELKFTDLIGQPTWIGFNQIQVNCVMRADLDVGDYVQMPKLPLLTTTSASQSQYSSNKNKSGFQGIFKITRMRHVGNYRQPPGEAWVTAYEMTLEKAIEKNG